jgi:hypothetical protein
MKRIKTVLALCMVSAALASLILAGCNDVELGSRWRDRDVVIDGNGSEWSGCESYYDEDKAIRIGLFNDDRYLYVFLAAWERGTQMQILHRGLTVWFDPESGKNETFGIYYPVKKMGTTVPGFDEGRARFGGREGADRVEMIGRMVREAQDELEILGPEPDARLTVFTSDAEGPDVEAMIGVTGGIFVYELRVPLVSMNGSPYAIGSEPGAEIGIGFTVGERGTGGEGGMRPPGMGMPPGGGDGGRPGGGMRPGGMGGRGGMERPGSLESIDLWAKVALAADSTSVR